MDIENTPTPSPPSTSCGTHTTDRVPFYGNRIILGNKAPSPIVVNHTSITEEAHLHEEEEDYEKSNFQPTLELEDCSFMLENCRKYCDSCLILFPTEHALEYHNLSKHSHLVLLDKRSTSPESSHSNDEKPIYYNCKICNTKIVHKHNLKRHYKVVHNILDEQPIDETAVCKVCQMYIPDKDKLINHLYMHYDPATNSAIKNTVKRKRNQVAIKRTAQVRFSGPQTAKTDDNSSVMPINKIQNVVNSNANAPTVKVGENEMKTANSLVVNKLSRQNKAFKCTVCKSIYATYNRTYNHFKKHHPEYPTKNMIVQANSKEICKIKQLWSKNNLRERKYTNKDTVMLARGVIFKCTKCNKHFLSNNTAKSHYQQYCALNKGRRDVELCKKCNLLFPTTLQWHHMKQHKFTDIFKTIEIRTIRTEAMNLLGRCPKCKVYFVESKIDFHTKHCPTIEVSTETCDICSIEYDDKIKEHHEYYHRVLNYQREDFIFIDYDILNETEMIEIPPIASPNDLVSWEGPNTKTKVPIKLLTLLYCNECKTYCANYKTNKLRHKRGICKSFKRMNWICQACGLNFSFLSYKAHVRVHRSLNQQCLLDNILIKSVQSKAIIDPPIPTYPKCKKCQTYFESLRSLESHRRRSCDCTVKKLCSICNINLSANAYKLHMAFHRYRKKEDVSNDIEQISLLERYQSIQSIWNILYHCDSCDLVLETFNEAVEHCQNHYSNESLVTQTKKCEDCKLNFNASSYEHHMDLHKTNKRLNRKTFTILEVNYRNLFEDNWISELFSKFTQDIIVQIAGSSIYYRVRNVKMNVIQDGRPELTVYTCNVCEATIPEENLVDHIKKFKSNSCKHLEKKWYCRSDNCNLFFRDYITWDKHQSVHKNNVTQNDYRIVLFNKAEDVLNNNGMIFNSEHKQNQIDDKIIRNSNTGQPIRTFYKCRNCGVAFAEKKLMRKHLKINYECQHLVHGYIKCEKCNLSFSQRGYKYHMKKHSSKVISDHLKIILFGESKESAKQYKAFQCSKCGLITTKWAAAILHSRARINCQNTKRYTCPKCELAFSHNSKSAHIQLHNDNPLLNRNNFNIRTIDLTLQEAQIPAVKGSKYVFYKCINCSIALSTSLSASRHVYSCSNSTKRKRCKRCDLVISKMHYDKHIELHKVINLTPQNRTVVQFSKTIPSHVEDELKIGNETPKMNLKNNNIKLRNNYSMFRCIKCGFCAIRRRTIVIHMRKDCLHKKKALKRCDICNIKCFSLKRHNNYHRRVRNLSKDNIIIKDVTSKFITKKYILHQCIECKICFHDRRRVSVHQLKGCNRDFGKVCSKCGFKFHVRALNSGRHDAHHSSDDFNRDNISLITFKSLTKQQNSGSEDDFQPKTNLTTFKCKQCQCLFHNNVAYLKHRKSCLPLKTCDVCGIKLPEKAMERHKLRNHQTKNIDALSDSNDETEEIMSNKLYKCTVCNVHFVSISMITQHSRVIHLENIITSTSNCNICGLAFPRASLSKHVSNHHDTNNYSFEDFEIIEWNNGLATKSDNIPKLNGLNTINKDTNGEPQKSLNVDNYTRKLYKCSYCDLNFLTYHTLIRGHYKVNHKRIRAISECPICELKFSNISLPRHINIHHKLMKLSLEDFIIVDEQTLERNNDMDLDISDYDKNH